MNITLHHHALGEVTISLSSNAYPADAESRENFTNEVLEYFQTLENQLKKQFSSADDQTSPNQKQTNHIISSDGLYFDEDSIKEALILRNLLQNFIEELSEQDFQLLQSVYSFFSDPKDLLSKFKVLFMGNIASKDKITRIYASKAIGSYKVTKMILDTQELSQEMSAEDFQKYQEQLLENSEVILKKIKGLLPRSLQKKIKWNRKTLLKNIQQALSQSKLLFQKGHNYHLISERYREFIYWLYANPLLINYFWWKYKYLKYWLYEELHELDRNSINHDESNHPFYTSIKLKIYQNLEPVFLGLKSHEHVYPKDKLLKKSQLSILSQTEVYLESSSEQEQDLLQRARSAELEFLNALTLNQLCALAEKVHKDISLQPSLTKVKTQPRLSANTRPVDVSAEQLADNKYMGRIAKVQSDIAKKYHLDTEKIGKFLHHFVKTIGLFSSEKTEINKNRAYDLQVENSKEFSDEIPRLHPDEPLDSAELDWVGYGKEFKPIIYEQKVVNIQKTFFDHGGLKIYLYNEFKQFVKDVLHFYSDLSYKHTIIHEAFQHVDSKENLREEVIYLRTELKTFLALGLAVFGKNDHRTPYFQVYRTRPLEVYQGVSKKISFTRKFDRVSFEMENFEKSTQLRPILFESLICVIDSFPDYLRTKHFKLLKGLHKYLRNEEKQKNNS